MSTNHYINLLAQAEKLYRHNRQGSYKTKERYFEAYKRFLRYVAEVFRLEKLANISDKHLTGYIEYMRQKNYSASTIKTDLAAIRFWHDKILNAKYVLPSNEEFNLERRRFGGVDRAWSQGEYNRMVALCWRLGKEDYAAVFTLARYAGLRIHECFRIDTAIAESAVKTGEITIKGKGGKVRSVPINESIRIELNAMLKITERGHKLFVPDSIQTHHAINQLQQFIVAHRSEVQDPDSTRPMTFHGLRHLYAAETHMRLNTEGYEKKSADKKVSRLLGHNRANVTRIYLASIPRLEGDE